MSVVMHRRHGLIKRALAASLRLVRAERGATAVEYGLIAALIVIAMIASFREVADVTTGMWKNISDKVITAR
jgi:pilus assembly protein Flp/PilA